VPPVHVPRVRDDGTGMITTTDGESLTGLFFGPSFFASHILAFERNVVRSRRLRIPVGEGPAVGSITWGRRGDDDDPPGAAEGVRQILGEVCPGVNSGSCCVLEAAVMWM